MSAVRRRRRRRGLTLIEILLVLAILVILGSIVGISVLRAQKTAYVRAATAQINSFEQLVQKYSLDVGQFPPSLEALVARPADLRNPNKWEGPYIDKPNIPDDPWGTPYQYEVTNDDHVHIWSFGPDRQNGTPDDVSNS